MIIGIDLNSTITEKCSLLCELDFEYSNNGYKWYPDLGLSIQGKSSEDTFFELIHNYSEPVLAMFLVLGVALVCSSIDTLQNAVVAVVSRDLTDSKIDIVQAKYVVVGMAPIAIFLAWF